MALKHSFPMPSDRPDLRGYVELALRGGFPDPVLGSSRAGAAEWLEGYVSRLARLVAELGRGEVVALEIKSTAAPTPGDARHIEWLREALGDRFRAGAVLHTGQRPFRLTEHVAALPICALWGPDGAT